MDNQVYLVTGGAGTFGTAFIKYILKSNNPKKVIVFSRDWNKHVVLQALLKDNRVRYISGDICDYRAIHNACIGTDVIVHAAAYKHVSFGEYSPQEVVRVNVGGSLNVINAAFESGVKKVVALSSDKSVESFNTYGTSKALAEKLFSQANVYHPTRFASVRYGNVMGSRGSVIPLWREQAKTGKITITNPLMTRFWITLPQAARFVMSSLETMQGGEVFVPKLPSCTVEQLANAVAPEAQKEVIGFRPGEKMHELLISQNEAPQVQELDDRYVIYPAICEWEMERRGMSVDADFVYTSERGSAMTNEMIQGMLEDK